MLVFICYARADQAFALPLAEQLKARGVGVWIDQLENQVSDDWDRDIDRALRECSHLLIVLSPASVESREVRGELRTALDLGKPVLPVLYQPCEIPRQLRVVQFVDFTKHSPSDELPLGQLLRALQPGAHRPANPLGPPGPMPASAAPAPVSPAPRRRLPALTARTKAIGAAALGVVVAGALWFGLDMATEERRRLNDAALSPDGAYMATVTGQGIGVRGAVRIWDVGSGRQAAFMAVDGEPVWVCAWSPDGKKLAAGDHAGTVRIYDSGTWRQSGTLTGSRDMIRVIAWSPDGSALATGDSNGSLWVWNVATATLRFTKPVQKARIDAVTWAHDGTVLASGSADDTVALVNAASGAVIRSLQGHASYVLSVAFSPDDELLASSSLEAPYLIVWDKAGNRRDVAGHQKQVERVAWSADGRFLASAATDNVVHIWDAKGLEAVRRVNLRGLFNSGTSLAWSPVGARLAVGDESGVQILNPDSDTPVGTLEEGASGAYDSVEIAGWTADGTRLGTFSTSTRTSSVWDVGRAQRLQTFRVGLWQSLTQ